MNRGLTKNPSTEVKGVSKPFLLNRIKNRMDLVRLQQEGILRKAIKIFFIQRSQNILSTQFQGSTWRRSGWSGKYHALAS